MAINVNENGTLKPLSISTSGFTINGIDYIGDVEVNLGADVTSSTITLPRSISSYKLLMFFLVDPAVRQDNQAYNSSLYGDGQQPFLLIPIRGMLKSMERNSASNGSRMWKFCCGDTTYPYLKTESADANTFTMRIYSSYNSLYKSIWALYVVY